MQFELLPWTELMSSLPLFGASGELAASGGARSAPYISALRSVVRGRGALAPIRDKAFEIYTSVRALPFLRHEAVGFTGPVNANATRRAAVMRQN
jgi:hypothetical protein